jgi:hypothetical protein
MAPYSDTYPLYIKTVKYGKTAAQATICTVMYADDSIKTFTTVADLLAVNEQLAAQHTAITNGEVMTYTPPVASTGNAS